MLKILLSLFSVLFMGYNVNAQVSNPSTFNLAGKINVESGKILLVPIGDSSYYPENSGIVKSLINYGKFNFSGTISYPYAFRLQAFNDSGKLIYSSSMFYIDSGSQKIICNVNSVREEPGILNSTTEEDKNIYRKAYIPLNIEFYNFYRKKDSISRKYDNNLPSEMLLAYSKEYRILEAKRDSILLQYTKIHPGSFVVLWSLIYKLVSGYQPIYDSIYSQFSTSLKQTVTGKRLYDQLRSSSVVNIGNKFPRLLLRNMKIKKSRLSINQNKKYTLIDFWFSHCFPCISQFGELKKLFEKYHKNKFDIISISVDDNAHINDWKGVINKFQLPWKQYLDLNRKEANRLSIQEFPTNFLLDKSGKIIATNIEPNGLELLLEKK